MREQTTERSYSWQEKVKKNKSKLDLSNKVNRNVRTLGKLSGQTAPISRFHNDSRLPDLKECPFLAKKLPVHIVQVMVCVNEYISLQWSLQFKTPLFNNSLHFKTRYQ